MNPIKVKRVSATALQIEWDDGHKSHHTTEVLRNNCPCASCKADADSGEPRVLLPILVPGKYELRAVQPVGSYALQLTWGDGHMTGIYTYEHLREICECEECIKKKVL